MATWDSKEREQFKIDVENIKNEIDKTQSEKIADLRKYVDTLNAGLDFQNYKLKDFIKSQENQNFTFENSVNLLNVDILINNDAIRSNEKQIESILKSISFYKKMIWFLHGCIVGVIIWILVNL